MSEPFVDFDTSTFWRPNGHEWYTTEPVTQNLIDSVETSLGYRLPAAYVQLMKSKNGGCPVLTNYRTAEPTSYAEDHVWIDGIAGIGYKSERALCGELGSHFWIGHWTYPDIGIYFGDGPAGGRAKLCLDYRKCGPNGNPQVVDLDAEFGYKVTVVAPDFESFIRGLEGNDEFDIYA